MSDIDTVQITVNSSSQPNRPPVANAGNDQSITLPVSSINLNGSNSSDPDNNIVSYSWTKILGPQSGNLNNANTVQAQATNLTEGIYEFELKVTDGGNLFDSDTVLIFVNPEIINQSDSINVIFYWPDPTGGLPIFNETIPGTTQTYSWVEWDDGTNYINLVTVKINGLLLSDFLAGVWCKNGCIPTCNEPIYAGYFNDKHIITFKLPAGTYSWIAESSTNVPNLLGTTTDFMNFFQTPHTTGGSFTVTGSSSGTGNNCLKIPIVF